MKHDIEADYDTLLEQSVKTVNACFYRAEEQIDKQFGEGFAKKNPALVAEFVRAVSTDFNASMVKLAAQDIRNGLERVAEAMEPRD